MTGAQVARTILQRMGIHDVAVAQVEGQLTDHYDPSTKAVRLSESVYASSSLAAAIAAHECGHVLQDVRGYQFMNIPRIASTSGKYRRKLWSPNGNGRAISDLIG